MVCNALVIDDCHSPFLFSLWALTHSQGGLASPLFSPLTYDISFGIIWVCMYECTIYLCLTAIRCQPIRGIVSQETSLGKPRVWKMEGIPDVRRIQPRTNRGRHSESARAPISFVTSLSNHVALAKVRKDIEGSRGLLQGYNFSGLQ